MLLQSIQNRIQSNSAIAADSHSALQQQLIAIYQTSFENLTALVQCIENLWTQSSEQWLEDATIQSMSLCLVLIFFLNCSVFDFLLVISSHFSNRFVALVGCFAKLSHSRSKVVESSVEMLDLTVLQVALPFACRRGLSHFPVIIVFESS
jgi:hypothetical protein